ncbi:MAG TPA: hypothetical protein VML75_07650, partial [Kofleriaceae bacterium]|nr:hypothetical protein [Kofleriaceae bacterium]
MGGECVATPDGSVNVDGGDPLADAGPDIDAGPDAAPRAGFGEPCLDKSDCQSNICMFVNTGGICTELCVGGSCPPEFGCFGVLGVIDPGSVSDVCV